jgi:uncharacterized protein (TIGR01777 family)
MSNRIVVVGATGTIGRPLCAELARRGYRVIVFSRDPARASHVVADAEAYVDWSPEMLSPQCAEQLRAAQAVIYLAGGPLFDGKRHSRRDVEQETTARMRGIDAIVVSLAAGPPDVFIAASSVGYYGYARRSDAALDETSSRGDDWWGSCSAAIERSALAARDLGCRAITIRTGYVLTTDSLRSQVVPFCRHAGGWIGLGRGWTPWIHITDVVRLIVAALEQESYNGPVNVTAPRPVRARAFARTLGTVLGRHAWLPVPTPLVRVGLGVVADIIVKGKRVIPREATENDFQFQFGRLDDALRDLLVTSPR